MPPETEKLRDRLREMLPELREKYGLAELKLFGSRVRGDHRPDSDLDVLVTFRDDTRPTLIDVVDLQYFLEDRLGLRIDLSLKRSLKPLLQPYILSEARPI